MRRIITSMLILLLNLTGYAQKPDPFFVDKISKQENVQWNRKITFSESINYLDYDLTYQRMEWQINPEVRFIQGKITSFFIGTKDTLFRIEFDLHDTLTVDSVYANHQKLNFSHTGNKLNIELPQPLFYGETDSVTVYYRGTPPYTDNGFGSFSQKTHGKNPEVPIIWTLSEPYGAMEWCPVNNRWQIKSTPSISL